MLKKYIENLRNSFKAYKKKQQTFGIQITPKRQKQLLYFLLKSIKDKDWKGVCFNIEQGAKLEEIVLIRALEFFESNIFRALVIYSKKDEKKSNKFFESTFYFAVEHNKLKNVKFLATKIFPYSNSKFYTKALNKAASKLPSTDNVLCYLVLNFKSLLNNQKQTISFYNALLAKAKNKHLDSLLKQIQNKHEIVISKIENINAVYNCYSVMRIKPTIHLKSKNKIKLKKAKIEKKEYRIGQPEIAEKILLFTGDYCNALKNNEKALKNALGTACKLLQRKDKKFFN